MSEINEHGSRVRRSVTGLSEDGGTVLLGELAESFPCEFYELVRGVFFHRLSWRFGGAMARWLTVLGTVLAKRANGGRGVPDEQIGRAWEGKRVGLRGP